MCIVCKCGLTVILFFNYEQSGNEKLCDHRTSFEAFDNVHTHVVVFLRRQFYVSIGLVSLFELC